MSEEIHNKIELAIEQLEEGLKIFLRGDSYVSALTLAGAAEEILGMALKIEHIENSLQNLYKSYHHPGLEWINTHKSWKEFTRSKIYMANLMRLRFKKSNRTICVGK